MTGEASLGANLVGRYRRHRYALLFYSLLATIAVGPLLQAMGANGHLIELLLAFNLLAAVSPTSTPKRHPAAIYVLVGALLLRYATLLLGMRELSAFSLVLWPLIAALAAWRSLRYALAAIRVDQEHLYAALSTYLIAGVFWGIAYVVLENFAPGSLQAAGSPLPDFDFPDAIYFSFVTLATLGYGDTLPVGAIARGLAIFEAVFGQLFLAVLVARLVGLRTMTEGPSP